MICVRSSSSCIMATTTRRLKGRTLLLAHTTIVLLLLFSYFTVCAAHSIDFDCGNIEVDDETCLVDRSSFGPIKAIVHGTKNDPFWQQVRRGMEQTAEDMQLELEMVLYDDEDLELDEATLSLAMVQDIQKFASYENDADGDIDRRRLHNDTSDPIRPAALIVSLPGDPRIETELQNLQSSGIPMFGINAIGSEDDTSSLFQGTVSMDEKEAGIMAGHKIRHILGAKGIRRDGSDITGIYINHRSDVQALKDRFDALSSSTVDVVKSWKMVYLQKNTTEDEFMSFFEGCKDTVIQLAGGSGTVDVILSALKSHGCNIKDDHIVGTFDTSSPLIYDAMANGEIKFAISQQPYLQGSNAMLMAALYATTGQKLNGVGASAASANIQTGPIMVKHGKDSYPSRDQQICEHEGFPVCSSRASGDSEMSECPCTDRSKISISVITHDESSEFWNTVFSGISQAAEDFGVSIQRNQFQRASPSKLRTKHSGQKIPRLKHTFDINEACKSRNTDGLIVSLPDANMIDSVVGCATRGIPYLAINAMAGAQYDDNGERINGKGKRMGKIKDSSSSSFLQYVGQKDYESGFESGKRLIEAGVKKGWCLVHVNFDTIKERCRGMEIAFLEAEKDGKDVKYEGSINVPTIDGISTYKETVEKVIGQDVDSDWGGVGVLSTGRVQIPALISLVEDHPNLLAGTFDLDSTLYKKEDNTLPDQIVFGIDQNAYMEGYLSVASMVWRISTQETSITTVLETGPNFIVQSDLASDRNAKSVSVETHLKSNCPERSIKFCGSNLRKWTTVSEGHPLKVSGKCSILGRPCGVCEGDCDDDTDCGEGLVCFVRDSLTSSQNMPVPGCNTNPIEYTSKDFCVDSRLYQCEDQESFHVRVGTFSVLRNCAYVSEDLNRCKEYGRYCRETCGYCRSEKDEERSTDY